MYASTLGTAGKRTTFKNEPGRRGLSQAES